ncbi:hypothetical protein ACSBR1_043864 [Camellia fascicularis]
MAGVSLKCGDCGTLLRSVKEAQEHAELTKHSNFFESIEPVLNLLCSSCLKPCRSKTESDLHAKRTGHHEFVDRTLDTVKPISLDVQKDCKGDVEMEQSSSSNEHEEMVVPEVDQKLLEELEGMGFPKARATKALHYSGNVGLEDAVNWAVEHENDADIDQMLKVPLNTKSEDPKPSLTPEETKMKAQELKERARKKKEEEEKRNGKREGEENIDALANYVLLHTFRNMVHFCSKTAERRRKLGLPPEDPVAAKPSAPAVEEKKSLVPVRPATKTGQMRECLRSLKQNHKDNEAIVKMAFNTLLTYARNVATNPNEEKFRKIRLSNATFQARVGALKAGIEFLELCGFKKIDGDEFLFLPRDKVDVAVLNSAGTELSSAINNPFFGVL